LRSFQASIQSNLASLEETISDLKLKIQALEEAHKKLELLNEQNTQVQGQIENLSEKSSENNIEIIGVTVKNSCDLPTIVRVIGENIDCPVLPSEIANIKLKRTLKNNCPKDIIILEFTSQWKKESFLRAGRLFSKRDSILVLPDQICEKIFVNQQLPPHKKLLLYNTKEFARQNNFKFVWIHRSQILLKKEESAVPIYIRTLADLPEAEL
jgi:hypothetical protein